MKALHAIAFILVVVGSLNWLLIGIGGWNVVEMLLGNGTLVERIVFILVGLSAVVLVCTHRKDCKCCEPKAPMAAPLA